jgi:hypothetical protein
MTPMNDRFRVVCSPGCGLAGISTSEAAGRDWLFMTEGTGFDAHLAIYRGALVRSTVGAT